MATMTNMLIEPVIEPIFDIVDSMTMIVQKNLRTG